MLLLLSVPAIQELMTAAARALETATEQDTAAVHRLMTAAAQAQQTAAAQQMLTDAAQEQGTLLRCLGLLQHRRLGQM